MPSNDLRVHISVEDRILLHLFEQDKWKEEFLKTINSLHGLNAKKLKKDNVAYNLIGLPFYNSEQSENFRTKFQEILN